MVQGASKIAFIGTGSMGRPMIYKLLDKGYTVQVYDKYPEAAKSVIAAGAIWRDTPKASAEGMDIVITCLPLPHHVLENMTGERGALAGMHGGSTWIDTSTTDYHNTKHIASLAAQKGVYSLEAPVSNLSHMGVDFANVSFYVGGDKPGFEISEDSLNTMGQISFYVGQIGDAQTVKLLTNILLYAAILVWGEVLTLAKVHGIPLYWMWDLIKRSKANSFITEQVSPFLFDGSYDHSCTLEIAVKDTQLTVELADELGVAFPFGRIVQRRYEQAGQAYDIQRGYVIVNKLLEDENGLDLRIPHFAALSKYGVNRDYVVPPEYVADQYGRLKPKVLEQYRSPERCKDYRSIELSHTLAEFITETNYLILQEAYDLGEKMGLSRSLLKQVIRWSCGACWVTDHEEIFQPQPQAIATIKQLGLTQTCWIPVIQRILDRFAP